MYTLEIEDEIELNVLHRLIIEAKFSNNIESIELRTSPYTCSIAQRVFEELNKKHPQLRTDIETYPNLAEKIPFMIKEIGPEIWNSWSTDTRKTFLESLICPFTSNSEFINHHIRIELSYNIDDYPEIFEQKIENIKYDAEVNDPGYWNDLSMEDKREEVKLHMHPYQISDKDLDTILNLL